MPAVDHLTELFEPVGGVTIKRMFGGLGVFKGGLMFALVADDVLYFKADETSSPRFAAEGCEQWMPEMKGRGMAMPYWRAPERLFDEPEDFVAWARVAFDVAVRTQKKPKGGKSAKPVRKAVAKKQSAAAKK